MNLKKAVTVGFVLCILIAFSVGVLYDTEVEMSTEISQIRVSKKGNFQYWNESAASIQALKSYVKDVTDKESPNFIPVEDRIATFDMDGTLIEERAPIYMEWQLYFYRIKNDSNYNASAEDRAICEEVERAIYENKSISADLSYRRVISHSRVFSGLTNEEFSEAVQEFFDTPVPKMKNMKQGNSFYLPMIEVISYLQANDFKVYIVSGADRGIVREMICRVLPIGPENIIGRDVGMVGTLQGDSPSLQYVFDRHKEDIVRGTDVIENVAMYKVQHIATEIGRRPVLAFGNSTGDLSMYNYTLSGNKYKSMVFSLLCDDLERDFGNQAVADEMRALCEANGYVPISMRNDWKTIYGYNVVKG